MIRMLIVGYCFGIRSERRLCEEVHLNLAYRWFCRLDLEDSVPDHSTFSKNRHGRFRQSDVFRHLFEGVLRRCMSEGLVGGEGFAIDASVVKADANRARGVPGAEASVLQDTVATRAVREYLDALDATNSTGDDDDADPPETRKNVSLTDPASSWTAAQGGPAFYAYSTNYLIDLEAGIIVDVEATPAHRSMEVESTKTMVDRVEQRFGLKPDRLVGDTARHRADARLDGQGQGHRSSCAGVGQDRAKRRDPVEQRVRMGRAGERVPMPAGARATERAPCVHQAARSHHQGGGGHLPRQPERLHWMPDEAAVLPEHAGAQDPAQRARRLTQRGARAGQYPAVPAVQA